MLQKSSPVRYLEPLRRGRSVFTESRIAVFSDGSICTVLNWLAWKKYGVEPEEWAKLNLFPFWRDGDRRNESEENIDIAARVRHVGSAGGDFQDVQKSDRTSIDLEGPFQL